MPSLDGHWEGLGASLAGGFPSPSIATGGRLGGTEGAFIEQLKGGTWELKLSDVLGRASRSRATTSGGKNPSGPGNS